MPDDNEAKAKGKGAASAAAATAGGDAADAEVHHYEEVAEYRIGEGPPPIALIVMFVLIVLWASLSWIPFFGY